MCEYTLLGLCLNRPDAGQEFTLFGFAQFVESLALFLVIFTISDPRAKFGLHG